MAIVNNTDFLVAIVQISILSQCNTLDHLFEIGPDHINSSLSDLDLQPKIVQEIGGLLLQYEQHCSWVLSQISYFLNRLGEVKSSGALNISIIEL